jgi:hypothetical protein
VGYKSLLQNTNGTSNTATGYQALMSNISGNQNTALGYTALDQSTTGHVNTGIGYNALGTNITGTANTAIGALSDVTTSNLGNATAIGYFTFVNASNKVVIGSTAVTVIGGQVGWSTLSDGRFKENIKENVPGLDFITKLKPVTYTLNIGKLDRHLVQEMPDSVQQKYLKEKEDNSNASSIIHTGFVAQDVEKITKELGYHFDGVNVPTNNTDNYSISYSQFVVPLVKAVQEQQKMITEQQNEIDLLKEQNKLIKEEMEKLKKK